MKTNKLKMIMTIFFTIFILCILSLTVNATNDEIEILEKLEEGEKKYIIYISTDSEFEFAFSDNSATEIDDLVFLPSVTDTNGNNVAYIDSTMSATTYLWVKNTTNNTMLIKGLKVDLTDTVTDSIVDEIADITKRIKVDMTKKNKEEKEIDGHKIYVYPPIMIICEKLRAICQKMKEYRNNPKDIDLPRARDFWDIYLVQENLQKADFKLQENREILKHVFDAKDVDMNLLLKLEEKRHIHENDFRNVQLTDAANKKYPTHFDFYFEYVLGLINDLEKFWIV